MCAGSGGGEGGGGSSVCPPRCYRPPLAPPRGGGGGGSSAPLLFVQRRVLSYRCRPRGRFSNSQRLAAPFKLPASAEKPVFQLAGRNTNLHVCQSRFCTRGCRVFFLSLSFLQSQCHSRCRIQAHCASRQPGTLGDIAAPHFPPVPVNQQSSAA